MKGLSKASHEIKKAGTIVISGHVNPDGDSIGSLLSLGLGLAKMQKRVYMISCDAIPLRYRKLPGADRIIRKITHPVDLAIAVDCSNREILGDNFKSFLKARKILEIDHHDFRRPFGTFSFIEKEAASVGEQIFALLGRLKVKINRDIAQNLMTSIIVETNSFRLPNVRPFTFEVCTNLIKSGIDFYGLVDTVFWSNRRSSSVLSGICLSRSKFLMNGRLCWSIIRREDFLRNKGRDEDVDAVPDEMRSIKSVDVAILFREKDAKTIRVSLRSKDRINVSSLAERYGGGGHFDVAGCVIPNDEKSIRELIGLARKLITIS